MVGPFMQGILLMGIIYWYTKGMMSMINDYYRSEFQQKLKRDEPRNDTPFDVDDFDRLLNIDGGGPLKGLAAVEEKQIVGDIPGQTRGICLKHLDYEIFMKLIFASSNAVQNSQFCWIDKATEAESLALVK